MPIGEQKVGRRLIRKLNLDERDVRPSANCVVHHGAEAMVPSQSLNSIVARIGRVSFDSGTATIRKISAPVLAPIIVHCLEIFRG